jgi:hypothetical protein
MPSEYENLLAGYTPEHTGEVPTLANVLMGYDYTPTMTPLDIARALVPPGSGSKESRSLSEQARSMRAEHMRPPSQLELAMAFMPGMRGAAMRAPKPEAFMQEVRGRDIPAGDAVLRWNPSQQWLDILQRDKPVGRTFVQPVNARTGNIQNPDTFILGPRVEDAYRRQGIGTSVYNAMTDLGARHDMRLVPGLDLSGPAFNMWRQRDPEMLVSALSRSGANARMTDADRDWLAQMLKQYGASR